MAGSSPGAAPAAGRIRQLPDGVVNQIAAGEVVERPASILKELMENAVDSGATRVEVRISGAFPYDLRVSDDGCGMTAGEMELAVRRHTTSKIAEAADLERISTYGFRGEALPSIGSVSRLRIVSRPHGQPHANEITVDGGAVSRREAGAPVGTTVEVSGIFANVPARLKFLKSPRTESSRLWEVFHAVAIPREGVAFRMADGRTEASYEAGESAVRRAARHAGDDARYLVPVDRASAFFRVTGLAGLPQLTRFGASGLLFFVNGRHFRDKGLYAAVREAYRGIIPPDRQPVATLFIECSPAEVDVNVHPGKTEVRFRYGRDLFELVRHAIGEALGEIPASAADGGIAVPPQPVPISSAAPFFRPLSPPAAPASPPAPEPGIPLPGFLPQAGPESPGFFAAMRPIGQLFNTYLLCESAGELAIVDQHAADERIVFSRLKDAYLGARGPVQRWLEPRVLDVPGASREEGDEIGAFLERAGFPFGREGEASFRVAGGPAVLGRFDVLRWWRDLCGFYTEHGTLPKGIFDADRELWRLACHGSVRGGDALDLPAMRRILSDLDRAVAAHSCPHGRPVWVRISRAGLERMFLR
jgi:DNA mismatch repair protein MutL